MKSRRTFLVGMTAAALSGCVTDGVAPLTSLVGGGGKADTGNFMAEAQKVFDGLIKGYLSVAKSSQLMFEAAGMTKEAGAAAAKMSAIKDPQVSVDDKMKIVETANEDLSIQKIVDSEKKRKIKLAKGGEQKVNQSFGYIVAGAYWDKGAVDKAVSLFSSPPSPAQIASDPKIGTLWNVVKFGANNLPAQLDQARQTATYLSNFMQDHNIKKDPAAATKIEDGLKLTQEQAGAASSI